MCVSPVLARGCPAGCGDSLPGGDRDCGGRAGGLHQHVQAVPHINPGPVGEIPSGAGETQLRHTHLLPRAHQHLQESP